MLFFLGVFFFWGDFGHFGPYYLAPFGNIFLFS